MAVDKLVDSTQLDSDLTSVANAIRAKSGGSGQLAFPAGFVSEIGNISGGGGSATLITKNINANGTYNASSDSADGYSKVVVSVPASAVDSGTKSINTNGTHDVTGYASASVNVPNSYAAGDEGKVVSNGALVAQTAHAEVTQNGTIDTTLNNSVTVNVSGGGGTGLEFEEGTYTAASDTNPTIPFSGTHSTAPVFMALVDSTGTAQTTANTGIACAFVRLDAIVPGGVPFSGGTSDGIYCAIYRGTSSDSGSGGNRSISSTVSASGFTPYFGTTGRTLQSGRTYKWIAVWR